MGPSQTDCRRTSQMRWSLTLTTILAALMLGLAANEASAQTFSVIHTFNGPDGVNPGVGLTIDRGGNLYGTTLFGGIMSAPCQSLGCGTVFKLTHHGSGWILSELYQFNSSSVSIPQSRVIFGPDGTLYGIAGGSIYNLRPPPNICASVSCPWSLTVLFTQSFDMGSGLLGDLAFDAAGNIYGTAEEGPGTGCQGFGCGTVYQLVPSAGGWTQNLLYQFGEHDGRDGFYPTSGVILDPSGNLYGVTSQGGDGGGSGTVFQMTNSGSGWTFNLLYQFENGSDGGAPYGGLIIDGAGNLYGTTAAGGPGNGGAVFELSPGNGDWNLTVLSDLTSLGASFPGPMGKLVMDSAGNLYGTTVKDGAYGYGNVFKLTPSANGWIYTSLHDFAGVSDGLYPYDGLAIGADGNLYGTTYSGGFGNDCPIGGCGLVFEITP
jgi:uncharacterized repeat protein (TIGR03803 family)